MTFLSILIGILLVIFKRDSLNVILIVSGVLLAITGALNIIVGIKEKVPVVIILGAVFLGLGIAMILLPNLFSDILMILLAVIFLFLGVSGVFSAFDASDDAIIIRILSIAIAALMIAAGVIILLHLNNAADWVMIASGILMIFSGASNVAAGVLMYRLIKAVHH